MNPDKLTITNWETFEDIETLSAGCHFTNCQHRGEPRCAVKDAVAQGRLDAARLESYLRLQDELASLARQQDERAQIDEKRRARKTTTSRPPRRKGSVP